MNWIFKKIYLNFQFESHGCISHVQLPILNNDWLYFATRNNKNISHIARFKNDHFEFYLSPSEKFDHKGIMPSCFCEDVLFYTGYIDDANFGYSQNICSYDGKTRLCLIDKIKDQSNLVNSPFVCKDGSIYKMWYISGSGWKNVNKKIKPVYKMNYAESKDLENWNIKERNILPCGFEESPSRPCVIKTKTNYEMFFSSIHLNENDLYQLQYAKSLDGINWSRENINIKTEENMLCYPSIFEDKYMLINGSDYGKKNILLYERS